MSDRLHKRSKRSPIGNSDIASMLARRLRGHVPLRAASPQHGWRLRVLGFFVCGVMCRCGVKRSRSGGVP